jgi:hypothetical protein
MFSYLIKLDTVRFAPSWWMLYEGVSKIFRSDAVKIINLITKHLWNLPTSTQLRVTWHIDSLDMVVLPSTDASRYHKCCIDGGTSSEYFGYTLISKNHRVSGGMRARIFTFWKLHCPGLHIGTTWCLFVALTMTASFYRLKILYVYSIIFGETELTTEDDGCISILIYTIDLQPHEGCIFTYQFFFPMPPHFPYGLRGLPSLLWPKCNRTLMRRSYVVTVRWMVIYEYEVPGGALNLNFTKLPRPCSPWGSSPSRKNPHGRTWNRTHDLMTSRQKLWPLDHEAGHVLKCRMKKSMLELTIWQ